MSKRLCLLAALTCILLSACLGRSLNQSAGRTSSGATGALPESSLLTVLAASPDEMESFSYDGNAPYYFDGKHGLWSKKGYGAILFSCPNNNRLDTSYLRQENALVQQFAEALGRFPIDAAFVEDVTDDTRLPQSDYMTFGVILSKERYSNITLFETGDIYVTQYGNEQVALHYKAVGGGAYGALKEAIADIRTALDALPLAYQLTMYVSPDSFRPESTALRLSFNNIGARPVTCSKRFILEKKQEGIWQQLSENVSATPPGTQLTVAPRGTEYYAVDLTSFEGAQDPGLYRVTNTFNAGAEQVTLTADYEISGDASEVSRPCKPDMTPENQAYYDKYLSMWGFYCPFERDYTEQTFAQDFRPYLLYFSSAAQEGRREEYERYGIDVPAQIVDETVMRHFPVTAAQFRAVLAQSRKGTEYYDPQSDSYHFEGGYGGVGMMGVVTHAQKEGNRLKLSCDWYDVMDSYQFSHTVTIRLGEGAEDFYYTENTVIRRAGIS